MEKKTRRRVSVRNDIEERIFKNHTKSEIEEYNNLQELYYETQGDYYAITHFLWLEDTDTLTIPRFELNREEAQTTAEELQKRLENIQKAYFNNAICKEVNTELSKTLKKPNRYPDTFIDTVSPTGEPFTSEQHGKYDKIIDKLSLEVYELEDYLLLELIQNPDKYRKIHEAYNQYIQEIDEEKTDPEKALFAEKLINDNLIDTLIKSEWLDNEGNEKPDGLFYAALEAARKAKEEAEEQKKLRAEIKITEKGVKSLDYPLDKVNKNIWDSLAQEKDGQLRFAFDTIRRNKEPEALVLCSIDFNSLEDTGITKRLTAYDKRVYIAVNGLYSAGYDVISINQIYSVITNRRTKPNANDREKINKALTKMASRVHLNNFNEVKKGYNYPKYKYDGALLPFDRIEAEVNGKLTDGAIRILRPAEEGNALNRALPLVQFAKQRNQYTTISSEIFGALSLTDSNLEIEDYLIEQIGHIKRGGLNSKMLYESVLTATHQTTKMQRMRAKEKINALLDHFKTTGFISNYTTDKDGITIICNNPKAITKQDKKQK